MGLDSILGFLDNKTILITGATGFLAKIFVEKILRVQPNVKRLYLLLRANDSKSALQRFNTEVVEKDLFNSLKEKYGRNLQSFLLEKVTPVAGDITYENLGVKDSSLIEEMWGDIDVVVNGAASTKFDERYDVALALNTFGAKNVLNFAAKCVKIKLLLHVSTAYVAGEKPGLILESPHPMGKALNCAHGLDINKEKEMIEEKLKQLNYDDKSTDKITLAMKDMGIERANKFGWPNTYVFTKALGEMILGNLKENIPLVILRPTIITSTYNEPFPGWIEGIRTIDSLVVGYGKGKLSCFPGDPESVIDVIPADMVVNAMIVIMATHANQLSHEIIYHVGSSVTNPLKYKSLIQVGYSYFSRYPWINKDSKPVIVNELKVLNSMAGFQRYIALRYLLPLQVLHVMNSTLCHAFNETYTNLDREIKFVLQLGELYKPYLFSKNSLSSLF